MGGLCIAGIIGNAVTLRVLQRDSNRRNSTNWLLQAHAVFDSLYLLTRLLTVSCPSYISVLEISTVTVTTTTATTKIGAQIAPDVGFFNYR